MLLRHSLKLLPLLLMLPTGAEARRVPVGKAQASSVTPTKTNPSWRYSCDVEQALGGGTISLSRLYTDDGKPDAGDFMRWKPRGYDPQKTQRPLELELGYIWEPATQPTVDLRKIEIKVRVGIDADLPEVAWIQMQRPFPVEPYGVIGSTALSTQVFPYTHDLHNGHGELPLGDLLAYAEGYDALDWTLIRPSDRLGGDKELARGTIDITALRQAVTALPTLRAALAQKTAQPKARCERIPWPDLVVE
ncbi:hypothetical protein ACSBM8_13690 [Sphingomonas sp. ASY06-1R]|jgi:hypothetical protein|uniref:hypothetical protein n=1 Tax=Sphingomonas sp. ASY06-1R TaxID=3445771 RepID=UPI003FA2DF2C